MRYLVLDFETTGFFDATTPQCKKPLPREDYPTQVTLRAINTDGTNSTELFSTFITGATRFDPKVIDKVPFTVEDTLTGMTFQDVVEHMSKHVRPDDILCGHHLDYDLNVLQITATELNVDVSFMTTLKRFDTQINEYTRSLKKGTRWVVWYWKKQRRMVGPSLDALCKHLNIDRTDDALMAHDARKDAADTASCVRVYIQRFGLVEGSFPSPFAPTQISSTLKRRRTE